VHLLEKPKIKGWGERKKRKMKRKRRVLYNNSSFVRCNFFLKTQLKGVAFIAVQFLIVLNQNLHEND
jgi:hypothetical protein